MSNKFIQDRRQFLKQCAAATLIGSGAVATQAKLQKISAALNTTVGGGDEYRALVCVFLFGGSDSFNMYVPTDPAQYAEFAASRPEELRVAREQLLPTSTSLGFNPSLPGLHSLFNNNNASIVRNVGNLVEPTTRQQLLAGASRLPFGLFAHDHQQEQWQKGWSSQPSTLVSSGWGGRIADRLIDSNSNSTISPNVSIAGSNFWIGGGSNAPVSVHPTNGLAQLLHFDSQESSSNTQREQTLYQLLDATDSHPMKQQLISDFTRAQASSVVVSEALEQSPDFATPYSTSNSLASQLRMVARLIAARDQLGMQRQVFFVALGGWDTHHQQNSRLPALMSTLDHGLSSFYSTLEELSLESQVTTFTASDFGRSLSINGDGTDHGWGGHSIVMGGALNGGNLYGEMPSFVYGGVNDAEDDGRIIPTTSINQYGGVLARWLGLNNGQVNDVFPDLANFGGNWDAQLNLF